MNEVKHLSAELNVDMAIANLLVQRGIKTFNDARSFFRPKLTDLLDPFLMKNMDKAVERLQKAIENDERVMIYGDYDVDGTTSVALMYSFLRSRITNIEYYIPDRYMEGYGVSKTGIEYAHQHQISLVIVLDCGIKAVERIAYAKELGVDFIVCDHHNPDDEIPDAVAVLDPKQPGCNYPIKSCQAAVLDLNFFRLTAKKTIFLKKQFTSCSIWLWLVLLLTLCPLRERTGFWPFTGCRN